MSGGLGNPRDIWRLQHEAVETVSHINHKNVSLNKLTIGEDGEYVSLLNVGRDLSKSPSTAFKRSVLAVVVPCETQVVQGKCVTHLFIWMPILHKGMKKVPQHSTTAWGSYKGMYEEERLQSLHAYRKPEYNMSVRCEMP